MSFWKSEMRQQIEAMRVSDGSVPGWAGLETRAILRKRPNESSRPSFSEDRVADWVFRVARCSTNDRGKPASGQERFNYFADRSTPPPVIR
jgi:hypothetical protein